MNKKLWVVVGLFWGVGASAETIENVISIPVEFTAQNHLLLTNRKDPEDKKAPTSSLLMDSSTISAALSRYDARVNFAHRFLLDVGESALNRPFVLEKKTVTAEFGDWTIKAGDSHQEFGRGIALSLYQDDVFGINHTLEGGSASYRGSFDGDIFAGRINALQAPIAVSPLDNPVKNRTIWLAGIGGKKEVADDIKLGGHYLFASQIPLGTSRADRNWNTLGAFIDAQEVAEDTNLYFESNLLFTRSVVGNKYQDVPMGAGTYAAITWAQVPWRVKLEGKDYRNYNFEFRRPPTLEEDLVETTNTQDVSAVRLVNETKMNLLLSSLETSMLLGYDRIYGSQVYHGVVGMKFQHMGPAEIELRGGYRDMPQRNNMIHYGGKAKVRTIKGQSVELSARKQYTNDKLNLLPTAEDRNTFDMTYNFSEIWNVSVGYEYMPSNDPVFGQHFASVGTQFKWNANSIKAFIGRTSGGTVCSGGVCRRVPPYEGALFETVFSL